MIDEDVLKGFTQDGNDIVYDRLADEIIVASKKSGEKYNIPPILILSVMQAESSFNLNAFSKEKAKGLMQINTAVWGDQLRKAGIISKDSDIYDPQNNIEAGCFILRQYIDETKDFEKAMNKYLGAYYKPYIDKIGRNVGDICMKNISKRIDATYKIK
jgi:soluble lytic murein transglycosylase-like protein